MNKASRLWADECLGISSQRRKPYTAKRAKNAHRHPGDLGLGGKSHGPATALERELPEADLGVGVVKERWSVQLSASGG